VSTARPRPAVTVTARPLWRMRLARDLPRHLLHAVAAAGVLACTRYTFDPPRTALPAALLRRPAQPDLAAEGFATLFARRYLTWEPANPGARESALAPFLGGGAEADAGMTPPTEAEQRVQWAQVVQEREPQPGEHVYTVAAQTDTAGLLYLTVSVARGAGGALTLAGYPAFVGPPTTAPAQLGGGDLRPVSETALSTVVQRGLRNYLAGSAAELAADLTAGAQVSLPGLGLQLESLQSLRWAPGGGAVLALVQAADRRGAQYTLAYELNVVRAQGRWEIAAIQMNPDAG
jgi:Conjugative transposon protein TcpC